MYSRSYICSHTPKTVLDLSHMTALDTVSFDIPSKTHELRDSRKVVALSQAIRADLRSQMLVRTRIRPDSARSDGWRLSTNLQPSLCPSLVLDSLFLHLEVVYLVVDVFRHRHVQDSTHIHRHRNVPAVFLPFP